jgi:hypothetical protein
MLIDFTDADAEEILRWMVINDHVMGGISQSALNCHRQLLLFLADNYRWKITVALPRYAGMPKITALKVVLMSRLK